MTPTEIIEKYEIPHEYADAIFEAYEAGGKRFAELQMERWTKLAVATPPPQSNTKQEAEEVVQSNCNEPSHRRTRRDLSE